MSPRPQHRPPLALGYVRVSTDGQFTSGAGLAAQEAAIRAEAERRGWTLLDVIGEAEGASSATLARPGLQSAMSRLDAGEADVLLCSKLDRLSRSWAQGGQVLEHAARKGWSVRIVDADVDTTTPHGEMLAGMLLLAAQHERRMIGVRTREALAVKRAQGVRLGRPQAVPAEVVARIVSARRAGKSMSAIARALDADGVPTAHGGSQWRQSSVSGVLRSQAASAPHP